MTRDYKNISESKARTKTKKASKSPKKANESTGLPVWFWLISGVVIGAFVSFLVYLKLNVDVNDNIPKVTQEEKTPDSKQSAGEKIEQSKEEKGRFEFYSILPKRNVEVSVDMEEVKEEVVKKEVIRNEKEVVNIKQREPNKNPPAKKQYANRLYVLQVGSFNRFKDADKRKANLAFLGVVSKIHAVSRANKTMYRVQVGPYDNLAKINQIASTLKQNKIPSLLMKVEG